jgi:hypothetical protein
MSMATEFYARFAAEERMAELRSEAQSWRLARAAAGRRCPPAYRLRLVTAWVAAASSQAVHRLTVGRSAPGRLAPEGSGPGPSAPQPCTC